MKRNLTVNIIGANDYVAKIAKDIIADELWDGISGKVTTSERIFEYDIHFDIDKDVMFDYDYSEGVISFWNGTSVGAEKWEINIDDCFKIEIM